MLNYERPVGATDDKSTNDEAQVPSSPNNGNTPVVGSQSPASTEVSGKTINSIMREQCPLVDGVYDVSNFDFKKHLKDLGYKQITGTEADNPNQGNHV